LQSYSSDLAARRAAAVAEVYSSEGLTGVDKLLDETEQQAWPIGAGLAQQPIEAVDTIVHRLESNDTKQRDFALGFIANRTQGDLDRIKELLAPLQPSPLVEARALQRCSDHASVWGYVHDRGDDVERAYWSEFQPNGLGPAYKLINEAIRHLLAHDKPAVAVDLISIYSDQTDPKIDGELAAEALNNLRSDSPEISYLRSYSLERTLAVVRASSVDEDTVALLEWRLLPALGFQGHSPALDHKLATDPGFFVQILTLCMRPKEPREEPEVPSVVAINAYRLLTEWKVIPGTVDDAGHVDQETLKSWVDEARERLVQVDRLDIGNQYIGQVLAHALADADDTWPELPIREVIEAAASHHVDQGFCLGIYNKRGFTSRGLLDGGAQEHALANQYGLWAGLIADIWPRTAANLRMVESRYREDGRREDEEAERRRQGLAD
jgi:hypothetical protein